MMGLVYITATFSEQIFNSSVFVKKKNAIRRKMLMLHHNICN